MVSSGSGTYELRSRTVDKLPPHKLKALMPKSKHTGKLRKPDKVRRSADLSEQEREEQERRNEALAKRQSLFLAPRALKHFNETTSAKQGPQYELVEAGKSNAFLMQWLSYHANFWPKPIGAPDKEAKLFFYEYSAGEVTCYRILDSGMLIRFCFAGDPSSLGSCSICGPFILHPLDGFRSHYG